MVAQAANGKYSRHETRTVRYLSSAQATKNNSAYRRLIRFDPTRRLARRIFFPCAHVQKGRNSSSLRRLRHERAVNESGRLQSGQLEPKGTHFSRQ